MKYNYEIIFDSIKTINDFRKLTKTIGELSKIKFIKYNRILPLIKQSRSDKRQHIINQDYEKDSLSREKEKYYIKKIINLLNIE